MKGKWEVSANPVGDEILYIVYRLRDVNAVDHSGNREYAGEHTSNKEAARLLAEMLNAEDPGSGNSQSQ